MGLRGQTDSAHAQEPKNPKYSGHGYRTQAHRADHSRITQLANNARVDQTQKRHCDV